MKGRLHLHSFWTRPCFKTEAARQTDDIVIWDYEMVTWLVSALQARRHGRIRLITDTRGLQFARRTGIEWVYNAGISTELDAIPAELDPELFWAASKVWALLQVDEPIISLDTDAVFWDRFEPSAPVMALHQEDPAWPWYTRNRERYGSMGFEGEGWDWELAPYTTAILYVESPVAARQYAGTVTEFMKRCSVATARREERLEEFGDAMLFAEQRLLPMCMARCGLSVEAIGRRHPTELLLARNDLCTHLWGSKAGYRRCAEARRAYLEWLVAFVEREHPEALDTLAGWNLDPGSLPARATNLPETPAMKSADLCLIENVHGVVSILDPNVGARRRAVSGMSIFPGESVEAEPGSAFELKRYGFGKAVRRAKPAVLDDP